MMMCANGVRVNSGLEATAGSSYRTDRRRRNGDLHCQPPPPLIEGFLPVQTKVNLMPTHNTT